MTDKGNKSVYDLLTERLAALRIPGICYECENRHDLGMSCEHVRHMVAEDKAIFGGETP